jgi:hypothetical protein
MATLLKVLINLADIKSARGVALRVGIQGPPKKVFNLIRGENRAPPSSSALETNNDCGQVRANTAKGMSLYLG